MKCFLKGALGAFAILVLVAAIAPLYSDYRARAQTSEWFHQLEPVQRGIEAIAIKQKSFIGIAKSIEKPVFYPDNVTTFQVTDTGAIIIKGGHNGQMLVLSPSFAVEKITWHCMGGPNKDMPINCRM
ncbi:MAG: hypothetical protein V4858_10295 [Pseudomonadota bacterium]